MKRARLGRLMTAVIGIGLLFTPIGALEPSAKAEFVLKLIDYVQWPAGKATDASGAVVISCVGDSPIAAKLKELAAAKAAEGLKVTVKTVTPADPVDGSQI